MSDLEVSNQLKFQDGSKVEVTIIKMGYEELQFGKKYVVHIKETIDGKDHILPSDGLVKKLKNDVIPGDKITIEKVAPDEKYPYGYFSVEIVEKGQIVDHGAKNFGKQFESDAEKLTLHEVINRLESAEKHIITMKQEIMELKKEKLQF